MNVVAKEEEQQIYPFNEIDAVAPGASITVDLHVDFAGLSESLTLSIESDNGSSTCSLCPPLGEMLRPKDMTYADFIQTKGGLQMKRRQTITTSLESAELVEAFKMMVDVASVIVPEEENDAKICFAGERIGGGGSVVLFELEIGAELQVFSEEEVSKKFVSDLCDFVIASITPPPAQDTQ